MSKTIEQLEKEVKALSETISKKDIALNATTKELEALKTDLGNEDNLNSVLANFDKLSKKLEKTEKELEKINSEKKSLEDKQKDIVALNEAQVRAMASQLESKLSNLATQEEKDAVLSQAFAEVGLDYAGIQALIGEQTLDPSQIFNTLGWFPIEQVLVATSRRYKFADLIPTVRVENGKKLNYVIDYFDGDTRKAYSKTDYQFDPIHNPDGNEMDSEEYKTTIDFHKGFWVADTMLNDITKSATLFLAITNNLIMNIAVPMEKRFYQLRLEMIGNLLGDVSTTAVPTDWAEQTIDFTATGADGYEALVELQNFLDSLGDTSRSNIPARYKFANITKNLEGYIDLSGYRLIVPIAFKNMLDVMLKSPRFHDKFINLRVEYIAVDYDKTFGEYNGDTNYLKAANSCDMRLVPVGAHEVIVHYDGTKMLDNANFSKVVHAWARFGKYVDKTKPIFNIRFNITGEVEG